MLRVRQGLMPTPESSYYSGWVESPHHVVVEGVNGRYLVILTGIVVVPFYGAARDWRRDRLEVTVSFPHGAFLPPDRCLEIDYFAPFVTLNAIHNAGHAVNAGWAVDNFGWPEGEQSRKLRDALTFWADLAAQDADGKILRLAYDVAVSGVVAEYVQEEVG